MNRDVDPQGRHEVSQPDADRGEPLRTLDPPDSRERQLLAGRNYAYHLSPAELQTMQDIGRFRTIDARDLEQYRYRGNQKQMRDDVRSLHDQGLVSRRTIWSGRSREKLTVFVLTKRGKALLEQEARQNIEQKIFAGFVKPAEVHHDAAIYRMYQAEAAKITRSGGRIRRVVLDYELKQKVYRPLAKVRANAKPGTTEYARRQAEIASQNRLKVVRGKILLPDLRIEYDTRGGEQSHVDLELATHHYRGSSIRAKAEAGFKMYAPQGSGLAAPFDPELTCEIFSF